MAKFDSTASTLAIATLVAVGIAGLVSWGTSGRKPVVDTAAPAAGTVVSTPAAPAPATTGSVDKPSAAQPRPLWAASATGRIEPKDGEIRIVPQLAGKIAEVAVKLNDKVKKGEMLVRLDDDDAMLKVVAASAEADVRKRERDEEPATGLSADRRKAEDNLSDAERALFQARIKLDRVNRGAPEEGDRARARVAQAEGRLATERAALARLNDSGGMPLPTRLESAVTIARSDLSAAESAVEKMHIRAPSDGTILNLQAKIGEVAAPSLELALVTMGDLSTLKVRAEVEERDATKVRVGQRVVVRADAFPGKDFEGVVTTVAQSLGTPRIASRGPRRPNDVEVLEVQATLDGQPALLTGMRVDVFFKLDDTADRGANNPATR